MASQSGHLCHRPNGPAASSSSNAAPCGSTSQVAAVTVPQQVRAHLSINENALESFDANFTPQIDCLMIASSSLLSLNRESIDSFHPTPSSLQLTYIISIITQLLSASAHSVALPKPIIVQRAPVVDFESNAPRLDGLRSRISAGVK